MLALPMLLGLASCAEHDNPVDPNPLAAQVSGLWWSLTEQEGTFSDATDSYTYTRIGQAISFNEDGTGYGVTFFFNNEEGDPIAIIGGKDMAQFTYTSTADGRLTLDFSDAYHEYADYFKQWTMTYANGTVTATNGTETLAFEKPGDQMAALIQNWDEQFNGGAATVDYNINDYSVTVAGNVCEPITRDNWREQGAIFIYEGGTGDPAITDTKGGKGYRLVNLPWSGGTVESNLPMNFCDKLRPENGWEWVYNLCGNRSTLNGNFFALYNKWTGTLRIFAYYPQNFGAGNDHLWEVTMNGQAAFRQGLHYGMPLDMTMKNPSALGLDAGGYSQYVSPWVEKRTGEKKIIPNAGWWAFDMDMSQYQPNYAISNDKIRLKMYSWTEQSATFFSTMTANIDGSFSATMKEVEDSRASNMRATSEGIQAGFSLASGIASGMSGEYGSMFSALGDFTGHAFNCGMEAGLDQSYTQVEGTINMTMNGTIDTKGIIKSSTAVTGIASPTIPFSEFDTKNTMFGRGVWNLKTSPVVWLTDAGGSFELRWYWRDNKPEMYWEDPARPAISYYPDGSTFYFFDPSSIEVELNPDLFPSSQVEWTQVEAYCVSHADNGVRGTDNYRKAFGLLPRSGGKYFKHGNFYYGNSLIYDNSHTEFEKNKNVFDFLYYSDDKWGLDYPAIISTPKYEGGLTYDRKKADGYYDVVVGRGKAGSVALEPMALRDDRNDFDLENRLPALEVMVCLKVKVKGQSEPYFYVRHYLPEIKTLPVARLYWYDDYQTRVLNPMNQVWQNLKARQPKGTGINRKSPTYDYEMMRIGKILNYINSDFKAN